MRLDTDEYLGFKYFIAVILAILVALVLVLLQSWLGLSPV